jgi:carbon storage regulator
MLVLSRQRDETIMIGDDIEITVVDIRGDKVRLGISAPRSVIVHRKEVWESIQRENREAAQRSGQIDFQQVPPPPEAPARNGQRPPARNTDGKADVNHQ